MASPSQPPPPRLHSFIAVPQPPAQTSSPRYGVRVLSPTKPTRHLSPRKFHQLQQQRREVVLRNMLPLVPLAHASEPPRSTTTTTKAPAPWTPAWLPFPVEAIPVVSAKSVGGAGLSLGVASLDEWLRAFDQEILEYESLEKFAQVKLPEALAFCEKMEQQIAESDAREQHADAQGDGQPQPARAGREPRRRRKRQTRTTSAMARFPVRFRVAVFASLVERAVLAMAQSAGLAHLKPWLLQARQELFRAVFADYDQRSGDEGNTGEEGEHDGNEDKVSDEEETEKSSEGEASESDREGGSARGRRHRQRRGAASTAASMTTRFGPDAPRPLSFFLSRVPYVLKLQDDSQRHTTRFQRHQVVLQRIVQSLYRSLGSVFHAWKTYTRQRREERLNDKGAQLTAMVVIQRGLVRTVFVEWSKCALKTKLRRAQEREALAKRVHDDRVAKLHKEVFLLREQTARLERERELALARCDGCAQLVEGCEDDDENDA